MTHETTAETWRPEDAILLHVCCGPCSLMSVLALRAEGLDVTAYFFNPNIHPRDEYALRRNAMKEAAARLHLPVLWEPEHEAAGAVHPEAWVHALGTATAEGERCRLCYRERLQATAREAARRGFAGFCTSLLYSRYQHHEDIRLAGEEAARATGSRFLYRDFRPHWQRGIELSKKYGLYRQKWCGCILSKDEAERQRAARDEKRRAE